MRETIFSGVDRVPVFFLGLCVGGWEPFCWVVRGLASYPSWSQLETTIGGRLGMEKRGQKKKQDLDLNDSTLVFSRAVLGVLFFWATLLAVQGGHEEAAHGRGSALSQPLGSSCGKRPSTTSDLRDDWAHPGVVGFKSYPKTPA